MSSRQRVPLTGRSNLSHSQSHMHHSSHHGHHHGSNSALDKKVGHLHHHKDEHAIHKAHEMGLLYSTRSDAEMKEFIGSARHNGRHSARQHEHQQHAHQHPESNSARQSARSNKSGQSMNSSDYSLSTARKHHLNNPLEVFRPYSPELKIATAHLERPPILAQSRFKTVPPEDPTLGVTMVERKGSVCPEGFKEKNQAPSWFETVDQKALLDTDTKMAFTRDFVSRNRDRLWKYDLKFLNRTPRDVCDDIIDNPGFFSRMKKYNMAESRLRLSGSEQLRKCFGDDHLDARTEIKNDNYLQSFNTSREEKQFKMTALINTAKDDFSHRNRRGYHHTTGYGTFSGYNGMIALNAACALNR